MNSELSKKGRVGSIIVMVIGLLLIGGSVFALAFINTSLMKAGPDLSKAQYERDNSYYNISITAMSDKIGTADNGKYHYYLIMDKNKNINLYEVSSKEADKIAKMDIKNYKASKTIKTVKMPFDLRSQLQKTINPRDYQDVNKATILSNYEFESERFKNSMIGLFVIAIGVALLLLNSRTRSRNNEVVVSFQEQYPQLRDMESIKRESDFSVPSIGVYIKGDYIVSDHRGFHMENLKDVVWMYQLVQRYYLFVVNRSLYLRGYKGSKSMLLKGNKQVVEEGLAQVFDYIAENYPQILIGFDNEKNSLYKERIKEYKNSGKMEGY